MDDGNNGVEGMIPEDDTGHGHGCPCLCTYASADEVDPSDPDHGAPGTSINDKPVWSAYESASYIVRPSGTWARNQDDLEITYSFSDAANIGDGFEVYTAAEREGARYAMDLYADVSGVTFVESADVTDANITFRYIEGSTNGGGWASYPSLNGVTSNIGHVSWEPEMLPGTYSLRLQLHELGHSMGLAHPGQYNGGGSNYTDNADHWNDTRQYSNMSYWGEGNTGASFGHMATLALHDILATQIEYGINWETRNDDTVYGYNSTAGLASYDLTTRDDIAFSIWDGGGEDTLDFSGSNTGTELDLRDGAFSSVNGQIYNVSIAYGAVIENGTGSAMDDVIIGNEVTNVLRGGAGNDTITGGAEDRPDFRPDARHFTGISLNRDPLERDQYLSVEGIDAFSGEAFTLEMMVDLVRMSSSVTPLVSYATSASSNTILVDAGSGGTIGITIAGSKIDTGIALNTLVDGQPHRVSISWEQATGALSMFVDGASVFSGTHQAGATIAAGGTLIFGQEQDSVGGGFDANQTFQGTVGDIRIFDTIRTASQIEAAAFRHVITETAGLVHDWRVSDDTVGAIADAVGGPEIVNLTDLLRDGMTATQSTTWGDSPYWAADKVLDGNTGSYSHTGQGAYVDQWLALDFGQVLDLTTIEIVNRASYGDRLDGAIVSLLGADGGVLHSFAPISGAEDGEAFTFDVPAGLMVASMRIDNDDEDHLQIAEIDVYGRVPDGIEPFALTVHGGAVVHDTAPLLDRTSDNDRLLGGDGNDTLDGGWGNDTLEGQAGSDSLIGGDGNDILFGSYGSERFERLIAGQTLDLTETVAITASQGSTWGDNQSRYGAQNVIDGDPDSFNHTNATPRWLELDLGDGYGIEEIVLHNRPGYEQRLAGAVVTLLDEDGAVIHVFDPIVAPGAMVTLTLDDAVVAQTVRVADSSYHLHLTEIDIYGSYADAAQYDGSNIISGGAGNDRIRGGAGADTLDGGAGADTLQYLDSTSGVTVDLAADAVTGLQSASGGDAQGDAISGFERVYGSQYDDVLTGDDALNLLFGFDGADSIDGGAGNDRIRGGGGADSLDGGAGNDWLQYSDSSEGVTVDLATGIGSGGDAAGDIFAGFEMLNGSQRNDVLTGDAGLNYLYGLGGDDDIRGGGGNDHLRGGAGADTLDGGDGLDFLDYADSSSGVAVDLAAGLALGGDATGDVFSGFERLRGSQHDDMLTGDAQANVLRGLRGDDTLRGGAGNDRLEGAHGADRFIFAVGDGVDNVLAYEQGRDVIELHGLTFDELDIAITARGANVDYGDGDRIRLYAIDNDGITLTADDFVFV